MTERRLSMSGEATPPKSNPGILSSEDLATCQTLAKLDIKLVNQRAQALLILHEGQTQAVAAEQTDLTIGQVRYLMTLFRKSGIALFPEKVLTSLANIPEEAEVAVIQEETKEEKQKPEKKSLAKSKPKKKKKKKKKKDRPKKIKPVKKKKQKRKSKKKK